jgi:hypothetical protein
MTTIVIAVTGRGVSRRVQLESVRGDILEILLNRDAPTWLMPTLERCAELLQLSDNWNSYGARSIDPGAVAAAIDLLLRVMNPSTPSPLVVPTNRGSVNLEWHTGGMDVEVKDIESGRLYLYVEDQRGDHKWDGELRSDVQPLAGVLAELAARA